ncbi:hypothetical protein BVRB_4g074230 [Beta vulgaris subsp. vulgaris]|nr:hypothetical protein BVRB_4g074230 [Beta vulgaris subsp. vulgaris]
MASAQQARDTSRITEEGKATINEQAKETQAALQAKCKLNRKGSQDELVLSTGELVLVTGVMKNLQRRGIMLQKSYDWKGQFISKPPDKTIGEHADGAFVHQGAPSIVGSKGAMIYGHFDHASPKLGWLLAWYRPDSSNELNKVYVEAGNLVKLMGMEWSDIAQKLDASRSSSRYQDRETGATADADIKNYGDKLALLRASFDHSAPIPNR